MRTRSVELVIVTLAALTSGCALERGGLRGGDGGAEPDAFVRDAGDRPDASRDASTDAGPRDASFDGGPGDAGRDGGPRDAGPRDAGRDGGRDAGRDAGGCAPTACPFSYCAAGACATAPSCRAVHMQSPGLPSAIYTIDPDGAGGAAPFRAYCEMVADGGGWTLLVKADGDASTFAYDAALWTDGALLGTPDLDRTEAKVAGYLNMPFTELRVGISTSSTAWLVLPVASTSLRALFSGATTTTAVGRAAWGGLVPGSSIQPECGAEGINVSGGGGGAARVRVGILGNESMDCTSCDSFIGIGGSYMAIAIHTGNVARVNAAGRRDIAGFGYIMVR